MTKENKDTIRSIADLKGKRIGVSAPGSSFHMGVNYLLTKAGGHPDDVSIVGIGASSGAVAVAAAKAGLVDALMTNDPVATILEESGDLTPLIDAQRGGQPHGLLFPIAKAGRGDHPASSIAPASCRIHCSNALTSGALRCGEG